MSFLYEFFVFGLKQARAAIFAGSFLFLLIISSYIPLFGLARYDFLFIAAAPAKTPKRLASSLLVFLEKSS